jgi:hypothetical protein
MRYATVTIEGRTYQIPDMWLMGMCRRMTTLEAVRHWHEQELMQEAFNAQRHD